MIDAPRDAAHLRDLAAVARGEATAASRAALYEWGVMLLVAYIWGDIDEQTFVDHTEDLITSVALLDQDESSS